MRCSGVVAHVCSYHTFCSFILVACPVHIFFKIFYFMIPPGSLNEISDLFFLKCQDSIVRILHCLSSHVTTVLAAKSDSDFMFCLQSNQGLIMDLSLVY